MNNYATCVLDGRCGNQFYTISFLIAYSKKHGLDMYLPTTANNCDNGAYYFDLPFPKFPTTVTPEMHYYIYDEPRVNDIPSFHQIPKFDTVCFRGYWQCFDYFNDYREDILNTFNIPYSLIKDTVSIHVRRGDYVHLQDKLKLASLSYYQRAVNIFKEKGYKKFMVFSDDIPFCQNEIFTVDNFTDCEFSFSKGTDELSDLSLMSSCEHNIVANSTFSYAASWLNRNPDKIVVTPSMNCMFNGANQDMIPKTDNYIQLEF